MPELPEVETTRRGIAPHIEQQTVTGLIVRQRQLRWPIPSSLSAIRGAQIESVARRAKYLLIYTSTGTAIVHLGMSGSLRIVDAGEPVRKHDHVDIVLQDGQCLRFHDPRRFGAILWTKKDPLKHKLIEPLGPEPLGDDFTGEYLFALSRKRRMAVKAFIMDSRIVVGVGNIYASEALFLAGIRPSSPAGRISQKRYIQLASSIRQVLATAIGMGGTTLRDFINPEGNPGYFKQSLNVYGRAGEPCPQCGKPIKSAIIGQRNTFFCTTCQPL